MHLGSSPLPAFALLAVLLASGCGTTQYSYVADFMTTRPVEADDPAGIWHDRERDTPRRDDPLPVRGVRYLIGVVDMNAKASSGTKAMKTVLEKRYSDTSGCATLWGNADVDDKTERLRIVVERKGYRTLVRDFTKEELANASMTTVVVPPKGKDYPDPLRGEELPKADDKPKADDGDAKS